MGTLPTASSPARRAQPEDTSLPIRVAVVGCGYWGPNIIRNFSELSDSELRIVCDRIPSRLEPIARRYPTVVTLDRFEEIIDDPQIDAVAICTPVRTHFELARAALEAGKHVLVEKPLSHSTATSAALVELARANDLTLMVDHTFVYSGAVRTIKSIIDSGEIGEVLYFDSVRINLGMFQHDVNVVWDLAPHDVSIMDYLLQSRPVWLSANGTTHFGDMENMAYITIKFEGSLLANFHVNWLAPVKLRSTIIGGSKRMIVYDDLAPSEKVRVYDKGVNINGSQSERRKYLVDYRSGDMFAPQIDKTEPLRNVCETFIKSIQTTSRPITDGEAGHRVVRILEASQDSLSHDGKRIYF